MNLDLTPDERAVRDAARSYVRALLHELPRPPGVGPHPDWLRTVRARLGADGWLGLGWPVEYGGQARTTVEEFLFFDEAQRVGLPVPFIAVNTVGPTLIAHGTAEQRDTFLPRILAGEIDFAIAYTEPSAGSDLASLTTRAVRKGDAYVVDGGKVFTSGGAVADYLWTAVRTDPTQLRHKGLSILMIDASSAGVSTTSLDTIVEPVRGLTATYLDGVVVPAGNRVGAENEGWRLITTQLNHERVAMAAAWGGVLELADEVLAWAAATELPDGMHVIDMPWVQLILARVHGLLEPLRLLNWRIALDVDQGTLTPASASVVKILGTEHVNEALRLMMNVLGSVGTTHTTMGAETLGQRLERAFRHAVPGSFAGGNNDVQRQIIAWDGLGMPRDRR